MNPIIVDRPTTTTVQTRVFCSVVQKAGSLKMSR